jgi:hypothetical protein
MRLKATVLLVFLAMAHAYAQDAAHRYSLFNPVPRSEMREFSIDRPDVTESPISVDAGHFQFEGDMVKWSKSAQGKSDRTINVISGLYKLGLTQSWDIHFGIEAYNIDQDPEGKTYDKGFGATTIRLKHNFWGNDGKQVTALGMIPYVTFVSGNPFDSDVVYGVGFPFSYDLSDKLGAGAQAQFDFVPSEDGGREMSYFQTIVLGGPLVGNFDFYVEGMGTFYSGGNWFTANGGIIYNVSPNVKVDVATNVGLTDEAPTKAYLGLSFRI